MYNISSDIRYIGAEDDNLDFFEAQYPLVAGISYNSYLILDEKTAIVDSVDMRRVNDWLANIDEALEGTGKTPEYLIVHHMEPDHSGSIHIILEKFPDIKIICTKKAADMLVNFFEHIDFSDTIQTVGEGDTLTLGRHELKFITAPMVHWPEVMMTVDLTEGILFSADAFGSFAMSTSTDAWPAEARRYYANIVGRFGPSVQTLLKKASAHDIKTIAPLHGPVIRENIPYYLGLYDKWSRYEPDTRGVFVAYASIYGGTAEAARRLASMLESKNAGEVVIMDLCRHDVSYAVAEAWRLSSMALCSATYDADVFPAMHNFLHHIEQKKLSGRKVGILENGSWAPAAANVMKKTLERMKDMAVIGPVVSIRSRMHKADIPVMLQLAEDIADSNRIN